MEGSKYSLAPAVVTGLFGVIAAIITGVFSYNSGYNAVYEDVKSYIEENTVLQNSVNELSSELENSESELENALLDYQDLKNKYDELMNSSTASPTDTGNEAEVADDAQEPEETIDSVPMNEMQTHTDGSYKAIKEISLSNPFVSNLGDTYTNGYYNDGFDVKLEKEYYLNGEYTRFSAILLPSNEANNSQTYTIGRYIIYCDDNEVYSSGEVSSNIIEPITIEIDLTGVKLLKIYGFGANSNIALGLLNPTFYK